ncbi:TetR/AcrR family transcriptional regulator [Rhodococcus opacus]|uniref:Putative TetR family transcriptional regulator n=1 Tax=Rhodococcus opacus (strain B4) TaxID=632772 RepID=C1B6E8_RHOOB|nr:TetR/AcrR family transcriptional regulator [Rhodococcus opacus]BAH51251.1 putative TetR family transcriptional regulator [Rhodococcus opacus B4]
MARLPAGQRREDYITAAVQIIAERGVHGATTRRIAERAQAPLASLHYCFHTKEELFLAIYEDMAATQLREGFHVRKGSGLGRAASGLLRQIQAWVEKDDTYAQAQLELFFWVLRQDSDLAKRVYQLYLDMLEGLLRQGLRPDDDVNLVEVLARALASVADGLIPQWLTYKDAVMRGTTVDVIAESLERLADAHRIPQATAAS